ncbi:MAG: YihY/virulence factor BrkB family protein [Chloroflexi bacterium]|nr:YihY/virulence factor BrkB family protein [Chloroflexota bacterium]
MGQPTATPSTSSAGFWLRQIPRLLGRALVGFVLDRGSQMSAAISYYALFSLFPLTLLAISIFGIVLRDQPFQDRVLAAILDVLPVEDETIADALQRVANLGPTLTFVSALVTLWTAAALSASLRNALNVVFAAEQGRPYLRGKAVDFLLMPVLGLPFIGGVALTTAWRVIEREVGRWSVFDGWLGYVWTLGFLVIPFGLTFVAFLLTFWLLPNRRLAFRFLWPGALVTTVLFEALKQIFAIYVHTIATFDAIYGPLSSVIVLLFWVYLTATIVVFGAEVSAALPGIANGGKGAGDWKRSTLTFLRGLVMAPENEVRHPVGPRNGRGSGNASRAAEARRRE